MARKACVIDVDLADVWDTLDRKTRKLLKTLTWGDEVTVVATTETHLEVVTTRRRPAAEGSFTSEEVVGFIVPTRVPEGGVGTIVRPRAKNRVLKVNFIDVQQGDAAVIETPEGKVLLLDGGESQMFARYLASRFPGTTPEEPKVVDAVIVTHGDADHFAGLAQITASETHGNAAKHLFMTAERVFHNGLVKRPSKRDGKRVPEAELLGATAKEGRKTFLTELEGDLLRVSEEKMNEPFRDWRRTLQVWKQRNKALKIKALADGDDKAFDWLDEGLRMEVLGPIRTKVDGKPALAALGRPTVDITGKPGRPSGFSASHTINGHSIVLRLVYDQVTYLFTGDLNEEAGEALIAREHAAPGSLRSDVLKVPHHGSADFSDELLAAISPIVSVVSSGDENARKEYIHPRANLVGSLGRSSRVPRPLVFVTEMVAFFAYEGLSRLADDTKAKGRRPFYGFSRSAYGAVKTRTDGSRLLVCTDSALPELKEAYAFTISDGEATPVPIRRA